MVTAKAIGAFRKADRDWRSQLMALLASMRAVDKRAADDSVRDKARGNWQAATANLIEAIGEVADLARKAGHPDWSRELRGGAVMLQRFAHKHASAESFFAPADAEPVSHALTSLKLIVVELAALPDDAQLTEKQVEAGGTAFARDVLKELSSGDPRNLDTLVRLAGRHYKNDDPRNAVTKQMGKLVEAKLVEPAGGGKSKRGAWRITDAGLALHGRHAEGK
ncbi:MAG: hypothetical protein H6816_16370 [Phycisphaerales bacterium]|nr:hypothetical protein [Phycisphaerales bacterium]